MNIKIQTCMLWVLLYALPSSGQTKGIINYILTVNDGMPGSPIMINYTLSFSGNKSIELPQKKTTNTNPSAEISETESVKIITSGNRVPFVYKDLGKNVLLLTNNISIRNYLVKDTLHRFEWQITGEQKKILNYSCTKATTTFRGRNYEAWFTEDIPLSNGPWKFGGLPGLIMEVYDSEKIFKYELSGIDLKAAVLPELIAIPNAYLDDQSISHKEFMNLYTTKKEELKAKSRIITYGSGFSSTSTTKLAEKIELF